jgi:hypothetical protein
MKAKKALKKLNKVEALLANVMEGFPGGKKGLGNLLGAAKVTIVEAIKTVTSSAGAAKNGSPARVGKARNGRLSEEGRKRISLAAKKRWAAAKRKGVNAVTGRRLSKTA